MQYPRMLYRDGTALEWNGLSLDTAIVADAEEEEIALSDGWRIDPFPHEAVEAPKRRGRPKKVAL